MLDGAGGTVATGFNCDTGLNYDFRYVNSTPVTVSMTAAPLALSLISVNDGRNN